MNAQPSIPRLAPVPGETVQPSAVPTSARLRACADAFSQGAFDRAAAVLGRMCAALAPIDACEEVLTPVARALGDRWVADTCDFATLTLAMRRLHALLHGVGRRWEGEAKPGPARRALIAAAPGDQHIFGAAMLAEAFRGAGWHVCSPQVLAAGDLVARVRSGRFEAVGLSLACDAGLESLARLIGELRASARAAAPAILVGGRVFLERPDLARVVGADGTAADCAGAVALAESLTHRLPVAA